MMGYAFHVVFPVWSLINLFVFNVYSKRGRPLSSIQSLTQYEERKLNQEIVKSTNMGVYYLEVNKDLRPQSFREERTLLF